MINYSILPKAYSEVYAFIEALGIDYKRKIPKKVYNNIDKLRDKNYNPKYHKDQSLSLDIISKEALALIAALNLKYWCYNEEKRNELKKQYVENYKKEQEKYSIDNIFNRAENKEQNDITENSSNEQTAMIKYEKNNIFIKIIEKLKVFFHFN